MADEPHDEGKSEPAGMGQAPADSTNELIEGHNPKPRGNEIVESVPVPNGLPEILRERSPKDPDRNVRTGLAWALTLLLVALALVAAGGWLLGSKKLEDLQAYLLVMSPIVTLTGTILGFYFSADRSQPKN
ncbi:hypothetical protein OHA70_07495 [Kribbella sp. NBC_00382]|uniref:hypothetical protein n=1 Tax=Kribbella sp. NBC_00382 TaxID=2975967 RepID=UPI002E2408AA